MTETLSDVELDLIMFVERFHASTGESPTDAQINARFDLEPGTLEAFKRNTLVQKSFKVRGIFYPPAGDYFSPEQMHAAAVMTDLIDRRSDEKKLRDLGITTRQWSSWLQDDNFADYLRNRSEKLVANSTYEFHKGMMKGVRNGNVASVKLAYELTGRFKSNEEVQVDIRRILFTFIEILQKHIKDPILLQALSMELAQAGNAESLSTGMANQMLSGGNSFPSRTISSRAIEMVSDE